MGKKLSTETINMGDHNRTLKAQSNKPHFASQQGGLGSKTLFLNDPIPRPKNSFQKEKIKNDRP